MRHVPRLIVLLATAAAGCAPAGRARDDYRPVVTRTDEPLRGRPELGMPVSIPGRDTCLVPLSMEEAKGWFADEDPFTRGGVAERISQYPSTWRVAWPGIGGPVRWHNALFRDLRTGEEWTLLDRRAVISAWHPFGTLDEHGRLIETRLQVFLVTSRDSNGDGVLNDLDERVALVTDGSGRGGREVTPPRAQVWSVAHDESRGVTYFLVVADTNGDGRVDHADEPAPHVLARGEDGPARPVVSAALAERALGLLR